MSEVTPLTSLEPSERRRTQSDSRTRSARIPQTFSEGQQLPQAAVPNIQWRGFGEVNYKVLDQRRPELGTFGFVPGSAGNFFTGDFDLFLTARISDRTWRMPQRLGSHSSRRVGDSRRWYRDPCPRA